MLAGEYGSNRDRNLIVDSYSILTGIYTKMATIVATQELGSAARKDFYSQVKQTENEDISQFIDYVKSLSKPLYFLTVERPKIETYEEFEKLY